MTLPLSYSRSFDGSSHFTVFGIGRIGHTEDFPVGTQNLLLVTVAQTPPLSDHNCSVANSLPGVLPGSLIWNATCPNTTEGQVSNLTKTTHDHDEILKWAEERGGKPTHVKGTGGAHDPGILRIDFPGYSGEGKLEPISWDEFFEKFDAQELALIYQEKTAEGERSNFNKIVSRQTEEEAREKSSKSSGSSSHHKKAAAAKK